jgi:hypothetical protein
MPDLAMAFPTSALRFRKTRRTPENGIQRPRVLETHSSAVRSTAELELE